MYLRLIVLIKSAIASIYNFMNNAVSLIYGLSLVAVHHNSLFLFFFFVAIKITSCSSLNLLLIQSKAKENRNDALRDLEGRNNSRGEILTPL